MLEVSCFRVKGQARFEIFILGMAYGVSLESFRNADHVGGISNGKGSINVGRT